MDEGFSQRLRQLRKERSLSQSELAERVSVHYNHIGRFERGISRPSADTLARMAQVLGVSADYLLEGKTDEGVRAAFADRELLQQFQDVEKLPDSDKHLIKTFLDAFLTKRKIQAMVRT